MAIIIHAKCWEIITPKESLEPMIVLNTYFEPINLEKYNNGEITEEELYEKGTGYVDAVGLDGIVKRLQYYEYDILEQNETSDIYKQQILGKWKCENISYEIWKKLEAKQ